MVMVASIGRWLDYINASDPYWKLKFCTTASKLDKSWLLLCIQVNCTLNSLGQLVRRPNLLTRNMLGV